MAEDTRLINSKMMKSQHTNTTFNPLKYQIKKFYLKKHKIMII